MSSGFTVREVLTPLLTRLVPASAVPSIIKTLPDTERPVGALDIVSLNHLMTQVATGLRVFGGSSAPDVLREMRKRLAGGKTPRAREVKLPVASDADVLAVQTRVQEMCRGFFTGTDCVRLATAASELARNIYLYAGRGMVTLTVTDDTQGVVLEIVANDYGPGIADLEAVMSGSYVSRTGLGRGLSGTKKLLDGFEIDTALGRGTRIRGWKRARR